MANSNGVESNLDMRIIRQVEYYFGDYNLPRDKFLQEQIKLDDGWIPLSTMLNFKRLAALTTDQDRIIDALKKSTNKLMEVDDEKKKIRRSLERPVPVMTENRQKELQSRTLYCKGFSKENPSLDKLIEFFAQYGSIENVQMRTYLDKATKEYIFKGSVFVVFTTKDEADDLLNTESIEYEGVPLLLKRQEDYFIDKKKERDDKKRMQRSKLQQGTIKQSTMKRKDDEEKESDDGEKEGFARGAVVHVKGVPSNATWEDIKSAVERVWKAGAKDGDYEGMDVAYVDFHMGDQDGWVRMAEAGTAVKLMQRAKCAAAAKDGVEAKVKKEECEDKDAKRNDSDANSKVDVAIVKKEDGESGAEQKDDLVPKVKEEPMSVEGPAGEVVQMELMQRAKCAAAAKDGVEAKVKKEECEDKDAKRNDSDANSKVDVAIVKKEDGESGAEQKDDLVPKVKEEPMSVEGPAGEVVQMEVCGTLVTIRALQGSEEDVYLEKAQGAREKRFMSGGKGRSRGGGRRGGSRKGRSNRGGKRKHNWDNNGPSNKRGR